jgi:hypothetical protein
MTRLASFCSGVLEVVNAVAVRLEDVVGEWVDGLAPRPVTVSREREAVALLARWNDDALINWKAAGGFGTMNSSDIGGWGFGVSNRTVSELINDTAEFFRPEARR